MVIVDKILVSSFVTQNYLFKILRKSVNLYEWADKRAEGN
jgi:hypothetical protein